MNLNSIISSFYRGLLSNIYLVFQDFQESLFFVRVSMMQGKLIHVYQRVGMPRIKYLITLTSLKY